MSFRLELENELSLSLPVRRLKGLGFARTRGRSGHRRRLLFLCSLSGGLGHQNGTLVIKFIPNIILALTIFFFWLYPLIPTVLAGTVGTYGTAVPVLRGMEWYL